MENNLAATPSGTLFVCCTSHMDWDWIGSFEDYYSSGLSDSSNPHNPVRYTLDQAYQLLLTNADFQFNLAELAWLKRWLEDNPDKLGNLVGNLQGKLSFLGGGITSPDNLICHGEVFIRNYLMGHQYLNNIGLSDKIQLICWIPDDFGQDPELPATLVAMGLKAAAFWRVPGNEPSTPNNPVDGSPSIYQQLITNGVCFAWKGSDGNYITALLLADGYGVPFYISTTSPSDTSTKLDDFVSGGYATPAPKWPNSNYFVPAGGDFSTPSSEPPTNPISSNLIGGIADYNANDGQKNNITAQLGTFEDYLATLRPGDLPGPITLNPSNFWTGYFAGRPQLKIDHNRAARLLMAAESAYSILQVWSNYSSGSLRGINHLIQAGWESLIPSSHHDFVTGTSPDNIYWSEQLPLLQTAVHSAESALERCLSAMARAVAAKPGSGEQAVVVYNDLGCERNLGTLVEVAKSAGFNSVRVGNTYFPLQTSAEGATMFQMPAMPALSYQTVYLSPNTVQPTPQPGIQQNGNIVTINNGVITVSISTTDNFSIQSLVYNNNPAVNFVNGVANQLVIYNDSGNLYQFGNELYGTSGFSGQSTSDLAPQSFQTLENGPLRWRFQGTLHSVQLKATFIIEYSLLVGEPLVRMRLTGAAPGNTSVVTRFPMVDANARPPLANGLNYGTANHWHAYDTVPCWEGETFAPTHDFAQLIGQSGDIGAVYHQGIPAWTLYGGVLEGVLLRNADGNQRGAAGTDFATHTQEYAYRLPGIGSTDSCAPLQEAGAVQQTPFAKLVDPSQQLQTVSLPESAQLAALSEPNALIRVVRTQAGSGSAPTSTYPHEPNTTPPPAPPVSLIFRIYQAGNTEADFTLNLPFATRKQPLQQADIVSALEKPFSTGQSASINGSQQILVANMITLATVRVQTLRPYLEPNSGK